MVTKLVILNFKMKSGMQLDEDLSVNDTLNEEDMVIFLISIIFEGQRNRGRNYREMRNYSITLTLFNSQLKVLHVKACLGKL